MQVHNILLIRTCPIWLLFSYKIKILVDLTEPIAALANPIPSLFSKNLIAFYIHLVEKLMSKWLTEVSYSD